MTIRIGFSALVANCRQATPWPTIGHPGTYNTPLFNGKGQPENNGFTRALDQVANRIKDTSDQWSVIFDGTNIDLEKPNQAQVASYLFAKHGPQLFAVRNSEDSVDGHVDKVHIVSEDENYGINSKSTKPPLTASSVYMSDTFTGDTPLLGGLIVTGGDETTLKEVSLAIEKGIKIFYLPTKLQKSIDSVPYGAIDEYLHQRIQEGVSNIEVIATDPNHWSYSQKLKALLTNCEAIQQYTVVKKALSDIEAGKITSAIDRLFVDWDKFAIPSPELVEFLRSHKEQFIY